jgi:hypothetical protein
MRKSLRYLRITWTVFCGIACLLLCVLWARSYWWVDGVNWNVSEQEHGSLYSGRGRIHLTERRIRNYIPPSLPYLDFSTSNVNTSDSSDTSRFYFQTSYAITQLKVPIWFLFLLSLGLAVVPWLNWRFSLHTLLIATKLVAMVLGAIVYASRYLPSTMYSGLVRRGFLLLKASTHFCLRLGPVFLRKLLCNLFKLFHCLLDISQHHLFGWLRRWPAPL